MQVQEIATGLWRWTGLHPDWTPEEDWGEEVGCVYLETSAAITIIDPLVPPEELARPDLRGGFAYYIDDFRDLD